MRGKLFCTLLVSLIHFSLTDRACTNAIIPEENDNFAACGKNSASLLDDEKKEGKTHCCLFISDNGTRFCDGVTDDEYENIKNYKKSRNEFNGESIDKIKCGSNYLSYSLCVIALLALIL